MIGFMFKSFILFGGRRCQSMTVATEVATPEAAVNQGHINKKLRTVKLARYKKVNIFPFAYFREQLRKKYIYQSSVCVCVSFFQISIVNGKNNIEKNMKKK